MEVIWDEAREIDCHGHEGAQDLFFVFAGSEQAPIFWSVGSCGGRGARQIMARGYEKGQGTHIVGVLAPSHDLEGCSIMDGPSINRVIGRLRKVVVKDGLARYPLVDSGIRVVGLVCTFLHNQPRQLVTNLRNYTMYTPGRVCVRPRPSRPCPNFPRLPGGTRPSSRS